jgi:hypothetical protein
VQRAANLGITSDMVYAAANSRISRANPVPAQIPLPRPAAAVVRAAAAAPQRMVVQNVLGERVRDALAQQQNFAQLPSGVRNLQEDCDDHIGDA